MKLSWLDRGVRAAGIGAVVLAVGMLAGWVKVPVITAVSLTICGAALILHPVKWFARALGAAVTLLSVVVLLRYFMGLTATMAPNTALAFALAGSAIMFNSFKKLWRPGYVTLALSILSPATFVLSLVALLGYAIGLEEAYGWSEYMSMGLVTAVGIFILSVGLIQLALRRYAKLPSRTAAPLVLSVGIGGLLNTVLIYNSLLSYALPRIFTLGLGFAGMSATVSLASAVYSYYEASAKAREAQEAARRLMIAEEERQRAMRSIEQMQAIWFHEARTPLTAFMSSIPMLREPEYAEIHSELLDRMEMAYRRIGLYMEYLAALETAVVPILFEITDMIKGVLSQREIFTATRRKPGDVTIRYEQLVPLLIQADQNKVRAMVVELVRNAIKFNREDGEITIETYRTNGDIALIVRDTGIGIDESDYVRIFEIGFQVDNSNTRKYEGHGFGLAMVRRVVLAHYGTIEVSSVLGEGSTFTVKLPR